MYVFSLKSTCKCLVFITSLYYYILCHKNFSLLIINSLYLWIFNWLSNWPALHTELMAENLTLFNKIWGGTQMILWWGVRPVVWNPYPYLRIFLPKKKKKKKKKTADLIVCFCLFVFFSNFCEMGPLLRIWLTKMGPVSMIFGGKVIHLGGTFSYVSTPIKSYNNIFL